MLTYKNRNIISNSNKIIKGIESLIDDDNFRIPGKYYFRIPGKYYAKPLNDIDLSWINDIEGYEYIAGEAGSDYMKGNNENELKLIKDFIT